MRKLILQVLLMIGLLCGNSANAANVPVTDMFPEDFVQECIARVISQGKDLKISDVENKPELSNIEGMDAWVSYVVRNNGSNLLTLQTEKGSGDVIMSIFLTVSYDEMDVNSRPMENAAIADEFIPVLAGALGMNTQESGKLFKKNYIENPSGSLWCPALGKSFEYSAVMKPEWKLIYFMISATDVNPDAPKPELIPEPEAVPEPVEIPAEELASGEETVSDEQNEAEADEDEYDEDEYDEDEDY